MNGSRMVFTALGITVEVIYESELVEAFKEKSGKSVQQGKILKVVVSSASGMELANEDKIDEVYSFLNGYFDHRKSNFDLRFLSLDLFSVFQQRVLRACADIPYGRVCSYGSLAMAVGSPLAARAVGNALARNPFPLLIPCHRVIHASGKVGCYGGGVALKMKLLRHEGIVLQGMKVLNLGLQRHDFAFSHYLPKKSVNTNDC
jgi:methylated-DNA-[protein]-cysteine S-methyltransferase